MQRYIEALIHRSRFGCSCSLIQTIWSYEVKLVRWCQFLKRTFHSRASGIKLNWGCCTSDFTLFLNISVVSCATWSEKVRKVERMRRSSFLVVNLNIWRRHCDSSRRIKSGRSLIEFRENRVLISSWVFLIFWLYIWVLNIDYPLLLEIFQCVLCTLSVNLRVTILQIHGFRV